MDLPPVFLTVSIRPSYVHMQLSIDLPPSFLTIIFSTEYGLATSFPYLYCYVHMQLSMDLPLVSLYVYLFDLSTS